MIIVGAVVGVGKAWVVDRDLLVGAVLEVVSIVVSMVARRVTIPDFVS